MTELSGKTCKPCEGGVPPLKKEEAEKLLRELRGWNLDESGNELRKTFDFPDHYRTMAFVNAVAWIAHQENHHPDLTVGYNWCGIRYKTHAIDGLSENDFICAAKVDTLSAEEA